jgi:hypothetical protein
MLMQERRANCSICKTPQVMPQKNDKNRRPANLSRTPKSTLRRCHTALKSSCSVSLVQCDFDLVSREAAQEEFFECHYFCQSWL